jgi:hypothetical protein
VTKVSVDHLLQMRLRSQGLAGEPLTTPVDVVRRLLAMQAQDFGAGQWAVGARLDGGTQQGLFDAMNNGEIVRSWPMRGTLFFTAAEDLPLLLSVTAERTINQAEKRRDDLGLDEATMIKARDAAVDLLGGGEAMTRAEFLAALEAHGIDTGTQRGYHFVWYLAHTQVICWGPVRSGEQCLVLSQEWLPDVEVPERSEAIAQLALRYFTGHGPATIKDFQWWSKIPMSEVRKAVENLRPALASVECNGAEYLLAPEFEVPLDKLLKAKVHALAGFDEHFLGYQDRSDFLDPQFASLVVPGANGVFKWTIVEGGHVVGTWKRTIKKKSVAVVAKPFKDLGKKSSAAFEADAKRYCDFMGLPAEYVGAGKS